MCDHPDQEMQNGEADESLAVCLPIAPERSAVVRDQGKGTISLERGGKGNAVHPHPGPLPKGEGDAYGIKYTPPTIAIASAAAPRSESGIGGIIQGAQLPGR